MFQYGTEAEKYLRGLFALDFPQYKVGYKDFDLVRNKKYPFIFATLDGRLIEKETGRKGILEIKTTEILKSMSREKIGKTKCRVTIFIYKLLASITCDRVGVFHIKGTVKDTIW